MDLETVEIVSFVPLGGFRMNLGGLRDLEIQIQVAHYSFNSSCLVIFATWSLQNLKS
jgi:hypothetical protein